MIDKYFVFVKRLPTYAVSRRVLVSEYPHVQRLAHKVLQPGDCVDGVHLGVHVDGVHGDVVVLAVGLHLVLVEVVGREIQAVPGIGDVAVVRHRADGHVQQAYNRA